eukprot:6235876-Prymnesium_polylepis.1
MVAAWRGVWGRSPPVLRPRPPETTTFADARSGRSLFFTSSDSHVHSPTATGASAEGDAVAPPPLVGAFSKEVGRTVTTCAARSEEAPRSEEARRSDLRRRVRKASHSDEGATTARAGLACGKARALTASEEETVAMALPA